MNQIEQWREGDLTGLAVIQLGFDYQVHVSMWSLKRELLVVFGIAFSFRTAEGIIFTCDREQTQSLCPLLSLLRRPVSVFRASSEGHCELKFANGAELSCGPHE